MHSVWLSLRAPSGVSRHGGGATETLREVGRRWVERGHRVDVIASRENSKSDLPENEDLNGVTIRRRGTIFSAPFVFPSIYSKIKGLADVVIENMHSYPLMAPLYVRKKTYITLVHGLLGSSYFSTSPFLHALVGYSLEHAIPVVYRNTRFAAVSGLNRDDLVRLGIPAPNIRVVPCGIDAEHLHPGQKAPQPTVLFLGIMGDNRKRVDDLLQAFTVVQKSVTNALLVIAGGGKLEPLYKEMARGLTGVDFVGYVSGSVKTKLLQQAWVFCMPSIRETFSIASMEANACGVPIVAYETPGLETVLHGENGLLVPRRNIRALADSIVQLLVDGETRHKMGSLALQHAKNFSWDKMATELLEWCEAARDTPPT